MKRWSHVAILMALLTGHAAAQQPSLTQLVKSAQQQSPAPPSSQKLESATADLRAALDELQALLRRSGARREAGWKNYLDWDLLTAAADGQATDLAALKRTHLLFLEDHSGLEMSEFTAVRDRLRRQILLQDFATNKKLQDSYRLVLQQIDKDMAEIEADPNSGKTATLGPYVGWLRDYEQAPELVRAFDHQFGHSNAHLNVSSEFIARVATMEIDNQQTVRNVIMGTTIRGSARTTGNLRVISVPSSDQAAFDLSMDGVTRSRNTGWNRGVTIFSSGITSIKASKRISFGNAGIKLQPADAACRTNSAITGIRAKSRLVRKIASRQAAKKKCQAEQIASRIAERQVEDRIDSEAEDLLAEFDERYREKFRKPLLRQGDFPGSFRVSTSEEALTFQMQQASRHQLAAPGPAPGLIKGLDASVRIHQSLVGNLSEPFWGGYTLTDQKLLDLLKENEIEIPDELTIGRDRWSITFADRQPMQVRFANKGFNVAINLKRIRSPRRIPYAMRISANYTISDKAGSVTIKRDGDVQVTYPGRTRLSASQIAAARFLRSKMRALFKAEINREGIELPERLTTNGSLKLRQMRSEAGWLSLGWNLVVANPKEAAPKTEATTEARGRDSDVAASR